MSLYTQKLGRNFIKSIFRALKLRVCGFNSVLYCKHKQVSQSTTYVTFANKPKRLKKIKQSLAVVTLTSVLLITSSAESNLELSRKLDTLHVVPGTVKSDSWKNVQETLIQDVNEDSIYQSFSKNNSAYFPVTYRSAREDTTDLEPTTDSNTTDGISDTDLLDASPEDETLDTNALDTSPEEETLDTDALDTSSENDSEPEVEISEPVSFETTSLNSLSELSKSFYRFDEVTLLSLPLVQESVIESLSVEESSDHTSIEESFDVPADQQPIEENVVIEPVDEEGDINELPSDVEIDDTDQDNSVSVETDTIEVDEVDTVDDTSILFTDFDLPKLESGEFIKNAQLRMSLAGLVHERYGIPAPYIDVEYSFGSEWINAGSVVIDGEISNALNGGYYLFALPVINRTSELTDFNVRLVVRGDTTNLENLFIDSLWLDIDTETFDREILEERLQVDQLSYVKLPSIHELISTELDFARTEDPSFILRYESQRNAVLRFFRSIFASNLAVVDSVKFIRVDGGVIDVHPIINATSDGLWTIQIPPEEKERLQPGTYTVRLDIDEGGKSFVDTFDFQWGMIAINSNQTEYTVGDTASVSLGALSSSGNTICDAQLALYVIDPNQFITSVPVHQSGLCSGNNVIDRPDYIAEVVTEVPGTYEMYVEHISPSGEVLSHTHDTFIVVPDQDIVIARNGPTRIYPPALYPMQITVQSKSDFTGTLVERVPNSFTITDTDARITEVDGEFELSWDLALIGSSSVTFSYSFDAPDISPYLYTLGPAEILSDDENIVVSEELPTATEELLAETIVTPTEEIDSAPDIEVATEQIPEEDSVPTDPLPEVQEDTTEVLREEPTPNESTIEVVEEPGFFESVVDTLFGDGEDTSSEELPTTSEGVLQEESAKENAEEEPGFFESIIDSIFGEDEVIPGEAIDDTLESVIATTSPLVATSTKTFVEHRKWQIASDATGSMLLYWASTSIPSGWSCVSCQPADVFYQRFVLGSSTPGSNGGSATHTHTASATTSTTGSAGVSSVGGGGADAANLGHGHIFTPAVSTNDNLPPYRQLVIIQYNSAGSPPTLPTNSIALFDASVPSGWTRYDAQDNYFMRGESTTTLATTGGTTTHQHLITGTTLASDTNTNAPGAAGTAVATNGHTHVVSASTTGQDHLPRYIEVILGKLSATSSPTDDMIAMWTDTPPSGWSDLSSSTGAFSNRFARGSASYGSTGGAATSTHVSQAITSNGSTATANRTAAGSGVAPNGHTHQINLFSFSSATNTPPYRTAIIAKRGPGGAAPATTTVHVLFESEKTGTSTPSFEFTGDDPDGSDTLIYQFEWDDDNDLNVSPIGSRTSDVETGCSPNCFSNTASSTDTSPFTDNERIRFTIQSALTSGTTYYFRVRVKESVGDTWSPWSTTTSFTVDAGLHPSAWFQSEGPQFDDGTLTNVSTSSGSVSLTATTTQVPTVVSGWNVATASPGTSITLTKPSNVEVGDLLLIIVGNDDNTDTDQWDNTSLKPTGFTLINEAGDAATSDAHSAAFYRVADGTENATTSVPAQVSADYWGYYIRVTGASTTNPINVTGADFNGAASPHAVTSITTTASNTLAFYVLSGDGADTYPYSVSGTGWSESAETFAGAGGTESGGTWGTRSMVTPGATGAATVAMTVSDSASGFQFAINPSYAQGTIMSPEIDFDLVSGETDWGSIAWSVTEPSDTSVSFRVYYTSTTSCDRIIPDSVVPGNSVGFDPSLSGVIIETLSTSTYNRICLKATLNVGIGTTSPTLNDWTVFWEVPDQEPYQPSLADTPAFAFMKSTTTVPTLGGFSAHDYESDRMEFELTVDDDPEFGSPNLTKNSSNYPVDTGWASSTFASYATTTYTIQPADALTSGTTYWWRVRARDPLGTNTWSGYSALRSITISNNITVPEWFETTDYQLGTSSVLTNATTTGADSVEIVDLDTSISLLDAWSLGTTKTISSGSNRVLIVVIFNEDAQTDNINTVTYGGQAMTEIYDHTTGIGGSNSAWVGYLTEIGIAAATNTTIVPTWTPGSPVAGDVIYHSAVFSGTHQTSPVRGYASNALTTGTTISPSASTTVYTGDMAFYIAGVSNNRTFTPDPAYTEGTDNNTCTSTCASTVAYKAITTDRTELPTATLSSSGTRVIMTFVALRPVAATGVIDSPVVDFDWVENQNDWGEVSWSLTEPTGSNSLMRVYYASSSSSTCSTPIPDGSLTGNSAGFTSAATPLSIVSLATSTYNRICLRMTLDEGTGTTSPTLTDWSVSWEPQSVLSQTAYQWYGNTASATPFDTWPVGTTTSELLENEPIIASNPTKTDDILRLRMGLTVSAVSATNKTFKLQYSEGNTCLVWADVGAIGSTTALWRGYNNAGLNDGSTLASSTLLGADTLETYEEENPSTAMPNTISVSARGEWDWVIQNRANAGTDYCFRMVNSDGTPLNSYSVYPQVVTNLAPSIATIDTPFDNEKVASTSPWFEFTGVDPEADDIDYQIQIDNDNDFSSTLIDTDSASNLDDFANINRDADRTPFDDSASIRYIPPIPLTNTVTYWWRVRPIDTEGSATYGDWITPRSLTVDTTATTTSVWFQTTEEQFDTDTLVGTDATASDLVAFASGSSTGTTTSSAIDFDDATRGNAWGEFSFTETGAANDILYHIEYYDGSSWALIPDSDLTGNAAGYDTSPVILIDLDTETYNQIRIRANFRAGSPTLTDWTVTWGFRVSVPTHLLLFDNEKTATTSPTFTFYTTDPESDTLEYEISWSTDNTFVTGSTTVISSSSPGFLNVTDGGLHPFDSGETISYTIQSALSNNTTYWWRTRAIDPYGSQSYSFWSDPWSFTTDTTATTSMWFQTTQEQFDTDTLLSLIASTSDSVSTIPAGVTTYDFSGITNPSASHVARYFEVDVLDPTDPPTFFEIDTLTTNGTAAGTPNLNSAIAGYANNAEASTIQYTSLSASDDNRWTTLDPGAGDNAVFWSRFNITEDPDDIDQIDILIEARQSGVPAGTDKGWFGIWRPGSTTPYWQHASSSQRTADATYQFSITSNISEYFDGSNRIHLIYFNEDDDDPVIIDYVQVTITSNTADSGVLTGTSLDFNDGNGPAWGQMRWNDSEPGLSTITYQLQYLTGGGSWALIPDGDLSGNSSGFSTTPLNLGGLDTTTYNEIRPIANFDCILSSCPTLSDWAITWSPGFTVSGTAFEYDGVASTTSGTVGVAVNGALQSGKTGTIQANGTWSISNVSFFEDDIITVFVNDGSATATDEAVAITQYDGTPDVSGMRLQKRHLSIGSDDYATISNSEIELFDFTDNENIFFDVDAGNDLTMCADLGCTDASIYILPYNTYDPGTGGNATMHDFRNYGTFTAGANTIRVGGSWDDNATTSLTTSSIIFTATTTTEFIDTTGASTTGFNNLTLGETSGTATWNASSTLDINGNLNVTYGTFSRGTTSLTIAGNLTTGTSGTWSGMGTTTFDGTNPSTWTDQNATVQNIGRTVVDGTAKTLLLGSTTTLQSLTIGADDTFDASATGHTVSVYTDWINNNTFTARTGKVIFIATTTNRIITAGGDAFYNLNFEGVGGTWSFTEADLSVSNNLTIATGTVTMPTGTTTLAGSFSSVGGTFAHNNALMYFTASAAKTIAASGTAFTNAFYNMRFTGSGSWSFLDTSATTSNDLVITQGTVTFPSNTLTVGGSFTQSGGAFTHNSGTVQFTSASAEIIDINSSSFNSLSFTGTGSWSFADASITVLDDVTVNGGTLTLPSSTLTLGGSFTNSATTTHNSGTVLFNSTDTGETISLGIWPLYNMTFNGVGGGWTISAPATTTNNFTLSTTSSFTLALGQSLAVGGTFTNSVGGASTTWTGSTLSLEAGNYSINTKTGSGDAYATLRIKANTDIQMWNSSSTLYDVDTTGSLYSQDHSAVDGDLYIFGEYVRTSGTEHWSYATDFDGTSLGGSSRQVDVRLASGTVALFSSSTLSIVGSTTASTTVANQGAGTYTVSVIHGTTTASRYDFTNLGPTGVTLGSSTRVTTLADGSFTVTTASGTAFTISSTTVDANPALQIYRVTFATTTAITAQNVTQNDGTPSSYWWFRESVGNITGEAKDNDTGDPGSIRWDDSSLVVTISGTVYRDDGVSPMSATTCDDATPNIRINVHGGSSYTGSCASADGTYLIPGVVIVGSPIVTVYLDTNGGTQGTVVTKTVTEDITDLNIYQNRIITRHEDTEALTIADMAVFDSGNDSDIRYDASTSTTNTLIIFANTELHIASSTTFAPGGDITINANASSSSQDGSLHIDDNATFTGSATSTYTLGGSFTLDTGATFTGASSTVIMNATTTGKTITTTAVQEITFNNLSFTGVGGGWNINGDIRSLATVTVSTGTVSGTADITVVNGSISGNGTLSMGTGTTTINSTNTLGGTTPWTFANLVLGSGSLSGTTTPGGATTTILGKLTISTGHYLDGGNTVWNLAGTGNVFVENGTFQEDTTTVRYSGTGATNILSTTYYNLDLMAQGGAPTYTATGLGIIVSNNMTVGGSNTTSVTFDTSDPALDVNGNVFISSNGTLQGSGSATFTVAGSWDNDGTYTGNSGTVTFDGAGTKTIASGNSSFSNVIVNGAGTFTITEHATATSAFTLTNAASFTVSSGQTLAVGGTFSNTISGAVTTWTGSTLSLYSGTNYSINASTTNDTYNVLAVGTNTDIRMWNSSASTYSVDSTGSLYSQDHANVNGELYIYGNYPGNGGTDYWNYATDFDGTVLGSPRKVDVYFASSSSVTLVSGGLSVVGISNASTTLQNQGAGTYGFRIGGTASTTWSYYEVNDVNGSGLTFSGTPSVSTLSYGDIYVGQNSGTGMTVGGTVITQNPAKTFTNNNFSTSTGVTTANNVTATGTTISSWRFTNHTGTIDGEFYNVDPAGDPGYIVWDDSAANITVSGTVYSGEGSGVSTACDGSTSNIHVRVGGLTSYTGVCSGGDGTYSIPGVLYSPGDSVIVYIDGESEKAATVTEDPVSNITGLDLYENRVIVRHESADPLSIADMSLWDSTDDADIPFTAVDAGTDTLSLPADRKLIVWTNKEFEPNGNVTVTGGGGGAVYDGTLELFSNAIFDATGNESHTVGGSLIMGSGATLDDETSTFTFTTSGSNRTIDLNNDSLYNAVFNGSGSWTITDSGFAIGNDLTITNGAVTLPSGTTTITGSLTVTTGSFITATSSTMVFNSSASETIRTGGSNLGTLKLNGTGSYTMHGANATVTKDLLVIDGTFTSATGTLTVGGNFINNDVFTHASGILKFISTTTALVTASSSTLYSTTFAGGGAYTFTDTNVALSGSLSITSGSATLATGTMSIAGSFLNTGGSFNHSSGTILFNSSDTGESINPGSSPFYAVTFASAGGGWTISGNATTSSNFSLTSATNFTVNSGIRLEVLGVFTNLVGGAATTWTGSTLVINSGSSYTVNSKIAGGDAYNNVIIGSSTALRMWDSSGTITLSDITSSLYSQDHAGVSGALNIYGDYTRSTGADYWSYATDFDGTALAGSSRQVFVYMAQNATTTFTAGTLNIIGGTATDTVISNQGSGTYALSMLGGTFNALYYSFTNMNADGLVLSGTTSITSLDEGNFTLVVNGGSLITLSSTTLNHNTGLVITGSSFATATAITGTNVEVVGTTPSAWTFTTHTGNLDGEVYDVDGIDDCGSIRWDDSSCLITEQAGYRFRNDDGGEGVPDSEWYDTDWSKRKRVTVTNADAVSYTNAVVKLTVTYDGDMQTDFDDLRFTSSDGTTLISHFRETYTASTDAVVWVKVPFLATSTDTEVFMYYGEGTVGDGSATTTFNVMDDFEDGNVSEYTGQSSEFTVGNTGAYERTYRLDASDVNNSKTTQIFRNTNVTVSQGQKIRFLEYIDTSTGGSDETCTHFGVQALSSSYAVCLELFGTDRMSISKNPVNRDTSGTVLASTTVSYSTGWYEVEVAWGTNNLIDVTLSQNGSVVATASTTDSTYTTGGIGFTLWGFHGGWDIYSARPLLTTEPTATFGFEQVSGGASWIAGINTVGSGIVIGDNFRVRFLVENTGLPITNQNFEIEYAAKGASPSCEAVSFSSYVEVPDVASCGMNDICMESSTHISNLASTTDILGGTGSFTYGQIVEDPSNNTGNISVGANEYTELEYVLETTVNADDSNYCLRVSNEGTDLDSYAEVAELSLLFEPSVPTASLNGGNDIILTGGATTTVTATGTVTDGNGYGDLVGASSTIYRSGVTDACSLDNNNCYIAGNSQCSFLNCSGNSCEVSCSVDIYYFAEPTDAGTYAGETWRATISVIDSGNAVATGSAPSIDLLTLRYIDVDTGIDYGALEVNENTGSYNATTTIQNIGNVAIDLSVEGTDLTDGGSSVIPVAEQIFATSTFTYSSCIYCSILATTTTNIETDLDKPTSTSTAITDQVFWGIEVPFGVAGVAHSGVNTFTPIGD